MKILSSASASASDEVVQLGDGVVCSCLESGDGPLFIECASERLGVLDGFLEWVGATRSALDRLICAHGGIVLRGFPISESANFGALTGLFPSFEGDYLGGVAPRARIAGQVMEATRLDKRVKLRLHSEMAYMQEFPARIAFFCRKAADVGGETIVADMRGLLKELPESLRSKIEALGIMTVRNFAPPSDALDSSVAHMDLRGWNIAFESDDPSVVEEVCKTKGLAVTWNEDRSLTVVNHTPATVVHPLTGQRLYRANLHSYTSTAVNEGMDAGLLQRVRASQKRPSGSFLGSGEPLSGDEVASFERYIEAHTRAWPWKNGDVMILDNLEMWHGRNPYEGSRDVQVALLA